MSGVVLWILGGCLKFIDDDGGEGWDLWVLKAVSAAVPAPVTGSVAVSGGMVEQSEGVLRRSGGGCAWGADPCRMSLDRMLLDECGSFGGREDDWREIELLLISFGLGWVRRRRGAEEASALRIPRRALAFRE